MTTQVSAQELQKKISGYLEDLIHETDQARKSEGMRRYLEMMARFHNYSFSNALLIMLARPDATRVAGFQTWKKLGRYVKKGERGIPIFAPLVYREDPDDENSPKALSGFKIVYVFDVSQTDGKSLPPIPQWKSPEENSELKQKLIGFAESKGIQVLFKELPGEIQGVSKGGLIEVSPKAGVKTLIHEIAHELMHHTDVSPVNPVIWEMEAESVAYVVSRLLGISYLFCSNYIVLSGSKKEMLLGSIMRISSFAKIIIDGVKARK